MGLIAGASRGLSILAGEQAAPSPDRATAIEQLVARFEESWKGPAADIDASALPSLDDFRDGVEDVCTELRVSRIVVLIDKIRRSFMRFAVTLWLSSPLSVFNSEVASLTVMDSVAAPTSSTVSTRRVCCTSKVRFCRTYFLNPGTVTDSSYVPVGNSLIE
jgi:hypothetical protein